MRYRLLMPAIMIVLFLPSAFAVTGEKIVVYAVNYPLQYFGQRIAGEHADVVLPVPPEIDPAFWAPDAGAVAAMQQAGLILLNGAGYAQWINRVSLPQRKLVNTSAGFADHYIETDGDITHSHGREGAHSHAGTAFTTWLDFTQAIAQAQAIAAAMSRQYPELEPVFGRNLLALEADLLDLDRQVREIVATDPDRPLLASHPVYQYFGRRYGLNLRSVMWEPDVMPTEAQWSELAAMRGKHPAGWMLWESDPNPEIVARLQSIGVESAVFDPCGNRPAKEDFIGMMQLNLQELKRSYLSATGPLR